jgi:hypothetical protein
MSEQRSVVLNTELLTFVVHRPTDVVGSLVLRYTPALNMKAGNLTQVGRTHSPLR